MKLALVINHNVSNTKNVLSKFEEELQKNALEYEVFEEELQKNALEYEVINVDNLKGGYDFICVIGGDGTILKTARYYANYGTPILGINLGRLGFLSQSGTNDIEKIIQCIKNKTYKVQERLMLKSNNFVALNDFVVKGCSTTRTSKFSLKINDKFVCDYIADGIIISTPTGSTAYGLSAGGPILSPDIDCLVIVPICPHTLTARPLVIPADEKITISSMDSMDELLNVAIDGQEYSDKIKEFNIEVSDKKAKLAFLTDDDFYSILRNKLHWGISPSNLVMDK